MKKKISMIVIAVCMTIGAKALTYEEVFDSIKAMPGMEGVGGIMISGDNDIVALGITSAQIVVWNGETMIDNETEIYGNEVYKLIGELPVDEMIQARMSDGSLFAIFAKSISNGTNRILILSDSAGAGFTGALIGYIDDTRLNSLRQAILLPREGGGTSIYLKALNF